MAIFPIQQFCALKGPERLIRFSRQNTVTFCQENWNWKPRIASENETNNTKDTFYICNIDTMMFNLKYWFLLTSVYLVTLYWLTLTFWTFSNSRVIGCICSIWPRLYEFILSSALCSQWSKSTVVFQIWKMIYKFAFSKS